MSSACILFHCNIQRLCKDSVDNRYPLFPIAKVSNNVLNNFHESCAISEPDKSSIINLFEQLLSVSSLKYVEKRL